MPRPHLQRRPAALLLALSLTGLAACSDDPAPSPASSAGGLPSVGPASPSSVGSPSAPSAAPSAAPSFAGDTETDTEDSSGAQLTVVAVRVARQAGFDRVVFELDGKQDGAPGWRVLYDDAPSQDGSGDPVAYDGETALSVTITGVGLPFDTGIDEVSDDPALPGDLEVVEDVVLAGTFEGQFQAVIGVSGERPFTVRRLTGPPRVVVDVAHG